MFETGLMSIKDKSLTERIWSPSTMLPVASAAPFGCKKEMKIPRNAEFTITLGINNNINRIYK